MAIPYQKEAVGYGMSMKKNILIDFSQDGDFSLLNYSPCILTSNFRLTLRQLNYFAATPALFEE